MTISDLATEWHWHRATVRSFLETLEAFGQLKRTKLAKSIVVTMPVQSGQSSAASVVQRQPDFAIQLQEVLSDWIVGKMTSADVGNICGQVVRQAMTGMTGYESRHCLDSHIDTASAHASKQEEEIRKTALGCIAYAALQRVLRKSRFDDSSPLIDFFHHDLAEEWVSFIEASKELAKLILDTEACEMTFDTDDDKERLKSLRKPFLSLLARTQEPAD